MKSVKTTTVILGAHDSAIPWIKAMEEAKCILAESGKDWTHFRIGLIKSTCYYEYDGSALFYEYTFEVI